MPRKFPKYVIRNLHFLALVPYIHAEFLPANILEWHYVIIGPKDSPYAGGYYHGALIFTKDFPFKPPSIYMYTPNGRFKVSEFLRKLIADD